MFDKIDYKTIHIAGREVRLAINHDEPSVSAQLGDATPFELRVSGYYAKQVSIGASVHVESGGEDDLLAGLYVGPLRLFCAASSPGLSRLLTALKTGRRVTSIEATLGGRFGDDSAGREVRLRGHLWDDNHKWSSRSRAFSVDLLDSVLGKAVTSETRIIDERTVVVPLPEGSFTTQGRVLECFEKRPGWPFKRFKRWVVLRETPAVVPTKGSDSLQFYNQGGQWTGVSGNNLEDGIAEFVRRVLELRRRYGGRRWANGVPAATEHRESHEVSVWQVDGKEQEVWRGALYHGQRQHIPAAGFALCRNAAHGGPVVVGAAEIERAGERRGAAEGTVVFNSDLIHHSGTWRVYGAPIGPLTLQPAPVQDVSVEAMQRTAERLHTKIANFGPAIGRAGRIPLRGMTAGAIASAKVQDPEWVAANLAIVAHAEPGLIFDGHRWVHPSRPWPADLGYSWPEGLTPEEREAAQLVGETMAGLDTTPPGPTEEAEGLAARERIIGIDLGRGDMSVEQDIAVDAMGAAHLLGAPRAIASVAGFHLDLNVVSAMSAVLGGGVPDLPAPDHTEADLPPPPTDNRPWLAHGDLVVVVERGETRQTIRLAEASSYRIGAHKDAEIRLIGSYQIAALLIQENGAVWIRRRSDNVHVDLLGLDLGEQVRLRDGAEVGIGQLYKLTIRSAATITRA